LKEPVDEPVVSGDGEEEPAGPVDSGRFSPASVHRPTSLSKPKANVFPVVHTPYDYDERF
jgi:hypothetical protein